MIAPTPCILVGSGVRLEPLELSHARDLMAAVRDGQVWEAWYARVPHPLTMAAYISEALDGMHRGVMLPWAVHDMRSRTIVGTTRYYDVVVPIGRVEIGYTWYGRR